MLHKIQFCQEVPIFHQAELVSLFNIHLKTYLFLRLTTLKKLFQHLTISHLLSIKLFHLLIEYFKLLFLSFPNSKNLFFQLIHWFQLEESPPELDSPEAETACHHLPHLKKLIQAFIPRVCISILIAGIQTMIFPCTPCTVNLWSQWLIWAILWLSEFLHWNYVRFPLINSSMFEYVLKLFLSMCIFLYL